MWTIGFADRLRFPRFPSELEKQGNARLRLHPHRHRQQAELISMIRRVECAALRLTNRVDVKPVDIKRPIQVRGFRAKKSFSTFNWPICRYRTSTPAFARAGSAPRCQFLPPPNHRPRKRSRHRPAAASSSSRSGSNGPRTHSPARRPSGRPLPPQGQALDRRQRHLRLEPGIMLLPCPLHVPLLRQCGF
jgi:hypothetical protein